MAAGAEGIGAQPEDDSAASGSAASSRSNGDSQVQAQDVQDQMDSLLAISR